MFYYYIVLSIWLSIILSTFVTFWVQAESPYVHSYFNLSTMSPRQRHNGLENVPQLQNNLFTMHGS